MWEIELRARVGPVRVLLWRTTDEEVTALVVAGLKERLKRATCARSRSVRRLGASWLQLFDAIEESLMG